MGRILPLLLLPLFAGCAVGAPGGGSFAGMHPGVREMLAASDDGQPMLTMATGVPFQGCVLTAGAVFDGAAGIGSRSPCAITLAGLRGTPSVVGLK